jgi:hypothetical protein
MIHFVTPLYRYNNIKIIYSTIINQLNDFTLHLIEGSNKIGEESLDFLKDDTRVKFYKIDTNYIWGHEQRNYFITNIKCDDNDWCYFLDDDNVITWDLVKTYNEEKDSDIDFILFSQKKGLTENIRLYSSPQHLSLGNCDIGSFMIRYNFIKRTLLHYIHERNADGHYVEQLKTFQEEYKFKYYEDRFVRYNSLSLDIN